MKFRLVENSFRRNSKWNDSIDRNITLPKSNQINLEPEAIEGIITTADRDFVSDDIPMIIPDIKQYVTAVKNNNFKIFYIYVDTVDLGDVMIFDRTGSSNYLDFWDKMGTFYASIFKYDQVIVKALSDAYDFGKNNSIGYIYDWVVEHIKNNTELWPFLNFDSKNEPFTIKKILQDACLSGASSRTYKDPLLRLDKLHLKSWRDPGDET